MSESTIITITLYQPGNFSQLYDDHETTDVKLKSRKSDRVINAHKLVLISSSNYFRKLFLSPMKKDQTLEDGKLIIYLEEVDFESFFTLIKYIYSLKIEIGLDEALLLLQLSNRFQVDPLLKDILDKIFPYLTLSDIFGILNSPEIYGNLMIEQLIVKLTDQPSKLLEELTEKIVTFLEDLDTYDKKDLEKYLLKILSSDKLNIPTESSILPIVEHYKEYFNLSICIRPDFIPKFKLKYPPLVQENNPNFKARESYEKKLLLTSWLSCDHSITNEAINPIRPAKYTEYMESFLGVPNNINHLFATYLSYTDDGVVTLTSTEFGVISKENSSFDITRFVNPTPKPTVAVGVSGCCGPNHPAVPPPCKIIVLVEKTLSIGDENILLLKDCHNKEIVAYYEDYNRDITGKIIEINKYEQLVIRNKVGSIIDVKLRLIDFSIFWTP